ncbi:hypothetical protein HMPREF9622_00002 [Cutibacterium modestum HL037PA3]|nr:hypothetical protein HMPREF9622_00002 [Cutibacterium modestum HL037PA3]
MTSPSYFLHLFHFLELALPLLMSAFSWMPRLSRLLEGGSIHRCI